MPAHRRFRRLVALVFALLPLVTSGCGLATALLVGAITDAIDGDNDDGGDPTILTILNDGLSTEPIVRVEIARADGAHAPYAYTIDTAPGAGKALKNIFDAGAHWVRVVYASGWRTRARTIDIIKDGTVSMTFLHGPFAPAEMAGTWFGAAETSGGVSQTYALTLDATGQAGARTIDGVAGLATGTLAETSEGVFRVTWSDTTVIALIADGTRDHAGLVTNDGTVGALQKGAVGPLPTGADADVVGAWTGAEVRLTGVTLTPSELDAASATVSAQQHWEGTDGDGDATTGVSPLLVTVPAYLRFEGDAESEAAVALSLSIWLTADRTSAFVRLTPTAGGTFPDADSYQLLRKTP